MIADEQVELRADHVREERAPEHSGELSVELEVPGC
jgi:hypothetical protein